MGPRSSRPPLPLLVAPDAIALDSLTPDTAPPAAAAPAAAAAALDRRFLVIGSSGSGKSTIINALLNNNAARGALRHPAAARDYGTLGTTSSVTAYVDGTSELARTTYIDTIGFTDTRYDQKAKITNLYRVLFDFRVGLSAIILVVKHGVVTPAEAELITLFTGLLGPDWSKRACLVITHYENSDTSLATYRSLPHCPVMTSLLGRFPDERITVGTMQSSENKNGEAYLYPQRTAMLRRIKAMIDAPPLHQDSSPLRLVVRDPRTLVQYIINYFALPKSGDFSTERLVQALASTVGTKEHLFYHDRVCLLQLESHGDPQDELFTAACGHVLHKDRIRGMANDPAFDGTCHLCRMPISKHALYCS
jgi:hypothetical protein